MYHYYFHKCTFHHITLLSPAFTFIVVTHAKFTFGSFSCSTFSKPCFIRLIIKTDPLPKDQLDREAKLNIERLFWIMDPIPWQCTSSMTGTKGASIIGNSGTPRRCLKSEFQKWKSFCLNVFSVPQRDVPVLQRSRLSFGSLIMFRSYYKANTQWVKQRIAKVKECAYIGILFHDRLSLDRLATARHTH